MVRGANPGPEDGRGAHEGCESMGRMIRYIVYYYMYVQPCNSRARGIENVLGTCLLLHVLNVGGSSRSTVSDHSQLRAPEMEQSRWPRGGPETASFELRRVRRKGARGELRESRGGNHKSLGKCSAFFLVVVAGLSNRDFPSAWRKTFGENGRMGLFHFWRDFMKRAREFFRRR